MKENTKNMLKFNQGKTEVVLFSSRFSKNYELLPTFSFGNNMISVTKEARNLGVMFDENLPSMSQINLILNFFFCLIVRRIELCKCVC